MIGAPFGWDGGHGGGSGDDDGCGVLARFLVRRRSGAGLSSDPPASSKTTKTREELKQYFLFMCVFLTRPNQTLFFSFFSFSCQIKFGKTRILKG